MKNNEDSRQKVEYLLSLGFEPVIPNDPECTLFKRGNYLESVLGISYPDLIHKVGAYVKIDVKEENVSKVEEKNDTLFEKVEDSPFEDVVIESDQYMYLCQELKKISLPVLRRISYNGNRYYFETLESGEVILYSSGTTLISDGYVDRSDALSQWKLKQRILGNDPDAIARERSDFGTIMHVLFGHIAMGKKIPFSEGGIRRYIKSIEDLKIEKERVAFIADKYAIEFLEDIRSFIKWIKDYNVKFLAIELMLRSKEYMVATAIDGIVEMDKKTKVKGFFGRTYQRASGEHKKGDPMEEEREEITRVINVIDFKSGRDGNFYPTYALQLELNRRMVMENLKKVIKEIDGIYNFAPKSWGDGKRPYHFRCQSDNRELIKADCVFEQGRINHSLKEPVINCYRGVASAEDFDLEGCVKSVRLVDYLSDPINWREMKKKGQGNEQSEEKNA